MDETASMKAAKAAMNEPPPSPSPNRNTITVPPNSQTLPRTIERQLSYPDTPDYLKR